MLGLGLTNSNICFLKSLCEEEEQIFDYNLFHSMMVDRKHLFLKRLWLALMVDKLLEVQVVYEVDEFEIRWWKCDGDLFFIIL